MDTLEFISSLVSSLAWPVAVVVALVMFRSTLAELLSGQLQRLRAGPVELEWERRVAVVQAEIDQPVPLAAGPDDLLAEFGRLAQTSPTDAVIEGQVQLEEALKAKIINAGGEAPERTSAQGLSHRAGELNIVSDETIRAVEGLQVLRNLAVHRPSDVTEERAQEYLTLVQGMLYTLDAPTGSNPSAS